MVSSLSSSVLPSFFPLDIQWKTLARFFLPPAAPKILAEKGSMMKLASPTLLGPRRGPTRPSRLHLRHKNVHFRSRSASRSSPLATSHFPFLAHSLPPMAPTYRNTALSPSRPTFLNRNTSALSPVSAPRAGATLLSPYSTAPRVPPVPSLQGNDSQRRRNTDQ